MKKLAYQTGAIIFANTRVPCMRGNANRAETFDCSRHPENKRFVDSRIISYVDQLQNQIYIFYHLATISQIYSAINIPNLKNSCFEVSFNNLSHHQKKNHTEDLLKQHLITSFVIKIYHHMLKFIHLFKHHSIMSIRIQKTLIFNDISYHQKT